jgi:2-polyprenyl-6-methoxyphenol hydroxylase-like FAD-dependent oxidoreductase
MTAIGNALIVGGGVGGMSAAIMLRRIGVAVDLIDINPEWGALGAGITITGPTLRAFKAVGVYDEIVAQAYVGEGIQVCDVEGKPLRRLPTPMPEGAGVHSSGGILRPTLHRILAGHVTSLGASVRTGLTIDALAQDEGGVDVIFGDGTAGRYDFVIGGDGLNSCVRRFIFPDAPQPAYTGQMAWRVTVSRPPQVERRTYFLGGPHKVGVTPISDDEMYLFLLERSDKLFHEDAGLHLKLAALLEGYSGLIVDHVRAEMNAQSYVNVRPLEGFEMDPPWHQGRVLLIGDAVHPTTPQLASGAGIAVEDAIVLAEELARGGSVEATMQAFTRRREWRCKLVVSSSVKIGQLEQARAPVEEQTAVVEYALTRLAEPV